MSNKFTWFMGGQTGISLESDWYVSKSTKEMKRSTTYYFTTGAGENDDDEVIIPVTKYLLENLALHEVLEDLYENGEIKESPDRIVYELFHMSNESFFNNYLSKHIKDLGEFFQMVDVKLNGLIDDFRDVIVLE